MTKKNEKAIQQIDDVLAHYANRGVFRSYGRIPGAKPAFRMRWHHDRNYDLTFDPKTGTLRFPDLLPEVPPDSDMYKAFKAYLKTRQSENLPEHRRIDPARARVRPLNKGGTVALSIKPLDGDLDYAARKLIHLTHEIFLDFLTDGRYYDYLVQVFNLNEDAV